MKKLKTGFCFKKHRVFFLEVIYCNCKRAIICRKKYNCRKCAFYCIQDSLYDSFRLAGDACLAGCRVLVYGANASVQWINAVITKQLADKKLRIMNEQVDYHFLMVA